MGGKLMLKTFFENNYEITFVILLYILIKIALNKGILTCMLCRVKWDR